jgi:hypothetical protein
VDVDVDVDADGPPSVARHVGLSDSVPRATPGSHWVRGTYTVHSRRFTPDVCHPTTCSASSPRASASFTMLNVMLNTGVHVRDNFLRLLGYGESWSPRIDLCLFRLGCASRAFLLANYCTVLVILV